MSTTPLMSEFPVDKKEEVLPTYHIDESDVELVVGQPPVRRCFWARLRGSNCGRRACAAREGGPKRSPIRRAVRWFLAIFMVLGIGFFAMKHHIKRQIHNHPIICTPVTDLSSTTLVLPLFFPGTQIGLHPSLTTGDVKISHSDDVEEGHVRITFELPEDSKLVDDDDEPKIFACKMVGPKFVGAGVHGNYHHKKGEMKHRKLMKVSEDEPDHKPPHHGFPGPKAIKTKVELSSKEAGRPRGIHLLGGGPPHRWGHGCMKKLIRKAVNKAVAAARAEKWTVIDHADVE